MCLSLATTTSETGPVHPAPKNVPTVYQTLSASAAMWDTSYPVQSALRPAQPDTINCQVLTLASSVLMTAYLVTPQAIVSPAVQI